MRTISTRASIRVLALLFLAAAGTAEAADLSGAWSGTWRSSTTDHKGPLKAEFVRLGPSCYDVTFRGRFFKILPFRYSVVMTATEQDGVVYLSGSKDLGRMFGVFSFSATADNCRFHADYTSCEDQGCFRLSRETCGTRCGEKRWNTPAR